MRRARRVQPVALRSLSERLVVIFDEFQRLRHCPGDPLALSGPPSELAETEVKLAAPSPLLAG